MTANATTITLFLLYLGLTVLIGLWQARSIKSAQDFAMTKMSVWRAATFLAGFTMGGASTYGLAGDTVKYGFTYLVWFPASIMTGWWLTGLLFARPYYRLQGVTLPTLLKKRFDRRTRMATSISTMIYAVFTMLMELYALAAVIRSLLPAITLAQATAISLIVSVASVAFSGMLGSSAANLMHSVMITVTFSVALVILWRLVGGLDVAIEQVTAILPQVAAPGVDRRVWLSATGLGMGVAGQLWLGKAGRLGGISVISSLSASCSSEEDALKAFLLAGLFSGVAPFMAGLVGILTAALLGPQMANLPAYSSLGMAVTTVSPVLSGVLLAAVAAAILSTFGPLSVVFSSVLIEDIIKEAMPIGERLERKLYPLSIAIVATLCAAYVAIWGIGDILPFIYSTAFPCTVPATLVALFGLYSDRTDAAHAFWAIALGVPIALIWGLVLDNPWGIHNLYVAFVVPLFILVHSLLASDQPQEQILAWRKKGRILP